MNEFETSILKSFKNNNQINFPMNDFLLKKKYSDAIDNLSNDGYINIKARSIGYVIANITDYGISYLNNI